jgi:hypothetical protein
MMAHIAVIVTPAGDRVGPRHRDLVVLDLSI